jgi:hypothetical protein
MALKAILTTIEGLAEDIVAHYKEKTVDGTKKFYLDVTGVDGLALEDVTALKTTVATLRKSEKTLRKDVESGENALRKHEAKFEGIDPKAAKDALNKIDSIKDWDGETKVAEAVKVATDKATTDAQARIDKLVADHNEKVTGLDAKLVSSKEQLNTALVTTRIIEAISKAEGNVDLLMPHVERQMKMVESDNGKFEPQVVDAKDERRYKDIAAGTYMDANDLLAEMKESATYAACFKGTGSSGAGKRGNENNNDKNLASKDKKVTHIKHDDAAAVSANLEGIANGSVVVDMPNTNLNNQA